MTKVDRTSWLRQRVVAVLLALSASSAFTICGFAFFWVSQPPLARFDVDRVGTLGWLPALTVVGAFGCFVAFSVVRAALFFSPSSSSSAEIPQSSPARTCLIGASLAIACLFLAQITLAGVAPFGGEFLIFGLPLFCIIFAAFVVPIDSLLGRIDETGMDSVETNARRLGLLGLLLLYPCSRLAKAPLWEGAFLLGCYLLFVLLPLFVARRHLVMLLGKQGKEAKGSLPTIFAEVLLFLPSLACLLLCCAGLCMAYVHQFERLTSDDPYIAKVRSDLTVITEAIKLYEAQNGPLAHDSLEPLLGRYLQELPDDTWGNPYRMDRITGRVYSLGADNSPGGTGHDADIEMRWKEGARGGASNQ